MTSCIGFCGLIFLLFGQISLWAIAQDYWYFTYIHLILGLGCLAVFLFSGGIKTISTFFSQKSFTRSLSLSFKVIVLTLIVCAVNYLAYVHKPFRIDFTNEGVYSLSEETLDILKTIHTPLTIRGFFVASRIDNPRVANLIDQLKYHSPLTTFEIIDPHTHPELVKKYGITRADSLHFELVDENNTTREVKLERDITESEIIIALNKLTRGNPKLACYITGHGEPDLTGAGQTGYLFFKEAVEGENIIIAPLLLANLKTVPKECFAIVLAAPQKEFLPEETTAIKEYLRNNGRGLFFHEEMQTNVIRELAANFGIDVGRSIIVTEDPNSKYHEMNMQPVANIYGAHAITAGFNQATILTTVSPVFAQKPTPIDLQITELIFAPTTSWAENNLALLFSSVPQASFDIGELQGALPMAAVSEKKDDSEKNTVIRLAVFGDADFITNQNIRALYNRDLLLNTINWVMGIDSNTKLRAKTIEGSTKTISGEQFSVLFQLSVLLLPELLTIFGVAVWKFRK